MVGIKDVAEKAGVSVTTVSRVLNKRGYISQEMYQRVHQAIEELNYYPNQLARNLYLRRTFMVGLVIPDVSIPLFSHLSLQIQQHLDECGYQMLLCNTVGKAGRERQYLEMLQRNKADGIIVGGRALNSSDYLQVTVPIVSIGERLGNQVSSISVDYAKGGEMAAFRLLESGCRNVLQIMESKKKKDPVCQCHTSFRKTIEVGGAKCTVQEIYGTKRLKKEAFQRAFFEGYDGVFASDVMAARILQAAPVHHVRIPQDLKIIGCGDTGIAELTCPRLTALCHPTAEMAKMVVELLLQQIERREREEVHVRYDIVMTEGETAG